MNLLEAFAIISAQHTPIAVTDSDYDFLSMWMECSCGWKQLDKEYNVEWEDHVKRELERAGQDEPSN